MDSKKLKTGDLDGELSDDDVISDGGEEDEPLDHPTPGVLQAPSFGGPRGPASPQQRGFPPTPTYRPPQSPGGVSSVPYNPSYNSYFPPSPGTFSTPTPSTYSSSFGATGLPSTTGSYGLGLHQTLPQGFSAVLPTPSFNPLTSHSTLPSELPPTNLVTMNPQAYSISESNSYSRPTFPAPMAHLGSALPQVPGVPPLKTSYPISSLPPPSSFAPESTHLDFVASKPLSPDVRDNGTDV